MTDVSSFLEETLGKEGGAAFLRLLNDSGYEIVPRDRLNMLHHKLEEATTAARRLNSILNQVPE